MKSAKEFWREKFGEYPQTDAERLAVVMMAEYAEAATDYANKVEVRTNELKELIVELESVFRNVLSEAMAYYLRFTNSHRAAVEEHFKTAIELLIRAEYIATKFKRERTNK